MGPAKAGRFQEPAAASVEVAATRALYVGPPLGVGLHRGAVSCLAFALDGTLAIHSPALARPLTGVRSALISAGLRQEVLATGTQAAFLYLDATDSLAHDLRRAMRAVHPLLAASHPRGRALAFRLRRGEGLAAFGPPCTGRSDPRVDRALKALQRGAHLGASCGTVAASVGLSASRFMHLFREHTGVPFRRYRLWARLNVAVRAFAAGANLSTAALDSGFATPSHLSDVFRQMFGVPPSVLRGLRVTLS